MKQLVLGILHHFCKNIFSGTFSRKQSFSGNFKTSILSKLEFSLPTYFSLAINYELNKFVRILNKWGKKLINYYFLKVAGLILI